MTITLKLVELNNDKFAVLRKDGFSNPWELAEACSQYPENIDWTRTWPLSFKFEEYCFLSTEADGLAALDKIVEALMHERKKIKIVRTIKTVKVRR